MDCTTLGRDSILTDAIEELVRFGGMSRSCACRAWTIRRYISVVVVVMNRVVKHIVLRTKDSTNDISGKGKARTRTCSGVTVNMITSDDVMRVQFEIFMFVILRL